MESKLESLRKLNVLARTLHLVSFILILSNDASLPVQAAFLTAAPGRGSLSVPVNLFDLSISYMMAGFMALSAFFHFLVSSPWVFPKYAVGSAGTSTSTTGSNTRCRGQS
ncbi:MAG: hypothetical protein P8Q52_06425 [Acidimicrobiales bacterium]|nr:hypothetical protein [Acidimicrobiales bacterium]